MPAIRPTSPPRSPIDCAEECPFGGPRDGVVDLHRCEGWESLSQARGPATSPTSPHGVGASRPPPTTDAASAFGRAWSAFGM